MNPALSNDPTIQQLIKWAEDQETVRAMLLTSTRAIPHATVDLLSDYDVILVVRDIHPLYADRSWLQDFGQVLVSYWDQIHPEPDYGIAHFSKGPPALWSQLEESYAGAGVEENWVALYKTLALFRQVASEVAEQLGYVYPTELDQQVTAYAQKIQRLPQGATCFP